MTQEGTGFTEFNFNLGGGLEAAADRLGNASPGKSPEEAERDRIAENIIGSLPEKPTGLKITSRVQWISPGDIHGKLAWRDFPGVPGLEYDGGEHFRVSNCHSRIFRPGRNYDDEPVIQARDQAHEYQIRNGRLAMAFELRTYEELMKLESDRIRQGKLARGEALTDIEKETLEISDRIERKQEQERQEQESSRLDETRRIIREEVALAMEDLRDEITDYIDRALSGRAPASPDGAPSPQPSDRKKSLVEIDGSDYPIGKAASILGLDRSYLRRLLRKGEQDIGGRKVRLKG